MARTTRWILLWAMVCVAVPVQGQTWTDTQPSSRQDHDRSHYRLDSVTSFVVYRIRSPLAPVFIDRRRLVEWLSLDHTYELGGDDDSVVAGSLWRIHTHLQLRLDQEFGRDCLQGEDRCLAIDRPEADRDFQVLSQRNRLDIPALSVSIEGPKRTQIRLGRQVWMDGLGFVRFDGVMARRTLHHLVDIAAFGGRQSVGLTVASSDAFATTGSIRFALPENLSAARVPFVSEPSAVWVWGARVQIGDARILRGDLVFRDIYDDSGLVQRLVGAGLVSRPWRPLSLRARVSADPSLERITDAMAEAALVGEKWTTTFRVRHHEPTFDLGSIWAYFDTVPTQQMELVGTGEVGPVQVDGALRVRRSIFGAFGAFEDERTQTREQDWGAELGLKASLGAYTLGLRGWLWAGDLAPVSAVMGSIGRRLSGRARISLRASVWHFDDSFRTALYATSISTSLGGEYRLTEWMRAVLRFEYGYNRVVGHRIRGLLSFTMRVWR